MSQSFFDDSLKLLRDIWRNILKRIPAYAANGILVNPINIINSNSYGNIVFFAGATKMKNSGVIELTG